MPDLLTSVGQEQIKEFFSTYFLLFALISLFSVMGLVVMNKFFPIQRANRAKTIVFTMQLSFHYIVLSLLVFLWFNFQLSDLIHGNFVNLQQEENEVFNMEINHPVNFKNLHLIMGDVYKW